MIEACCGQASAPRKVIQRLCSGSFLDEDFRSAPSALLLRRVSHVIINVMILKRTTPVSPGEDAIRRPLMELHDALLRLHKTLLDSERVVYEKEIGPIQSPNHFFHLLTCDPWFAWLRPISQLIVAIDETLDANEALTGGSIDAVMNQSVFLLVPKRIGGAFGERYVAALQRDPRVVLAHAKVAKWIGSGKPAV